jgi:hypothetical protein
MINETTITIPAKLISECQEFEEMKFASQYGFKDEKEKDRIHDELLANTTLRSQYVLHHYIFQENHRPCFLYLTIEADKQVFFSLATHTDDSEIPLYEGLP